MRFPRRPVEGWGFDEFARKHGDAAQAGAAAILTGRRVVATARLVVFGVGERPGRLGDVEAALVGKPLDEATLTPVLSDLPVLVAETCRVALTDAGERADVRG